MRHFILAACMIAATSTSAIAQSQSIVLAPSNDPALALDGFGQPGVPTVGQTFTIPGTAAFLTDFHFSLANDVNYGTGAELLFRPYLMAWNGTNATGDNLLLFNPAEPGSVAPEGSYMDYLFAAGVPVTPGDMYVAFLSASGVPQSGSGLNRIFGTEAPYSDGQLVYAFTDNDAPDFTSPDVWYNGGDADLAFTANFSNTSTVPEPSEFVLLATGFSGLAGVVRLRRRRTIAA